MKPQRCIAKGQEQGDCWRACVATILNLPATEVPNFVDLGGEDWKAWPKLTREWLAERGLALYEMCCSAEYTIESLLKWRSHDSPDVPVILVGSSANDSHAVVAMGGKIVHDPSGAGISGPCTCDCSEGCKGTWWLFIIAFGANSALKLQAA